MPRQRTTRASLLIPKYRNIVTRVTQRLTSTSRSNRQNLTCLRLIMPRRRRISQLSRRLHMRNHYHRLTSISNSLGHRSTTSHRSNDRQGSMTNLSHQRPRQARMRHRTLPARPILSSKLNLLSPTSARPVNLSHTTHINTLNSHTLSNNMTNRLHNMHHEYPPRMPTKARRSK